jgi:hypothetical protein
LMCVRCRKCWFLECWRDQAFYQKLEADAARAGGDARRASESEDN